MLVMTEVNRPHLGRRRAAHAADCVCRLGRRCRRWREHARRGRRRRAQGCTRADRAPVIVVLVVFECCIGRRWWRRRREPHVGRHHPTRAADRVRRLRRRGWRRRKRRRIGRRRREPHADRRRAADAAHRVCQLGRRRRRRRERAQRGRRWRTKGACACIECPSSSSLSPSNASLVDGGGTAPQHAFYHRRDQRHDHHTSHHHRESPFVMSDRVVVNSTEGPFASARPFVKTFVPCGVGPWADYKGHHAHRI